jgi:phenylalanyl-tRNA synthetase beta chain
MKVSLNWLKEHVALELSAKELAPKLMALGFEVASIESKGPQFRGVVTAKVLDVVQHPNADRLRLCTVDDGAAKFSVVCGAPNVAAGQTVALARVGAELPGGKKLGPAKIRGVDSQGMLCSGAELGMPGDAAGIMVLGEGTPLGQDFAAMQGPGDELLEVEITPNRPDCLSHRGLARELAAYLRVPLKSAPPAPVPPQASETCPLISVESPEACPLYIGRLITGVKVGPSPAWLAAKLEAVGLKPINNVVDVTNYMLMDIGQPMHGFDASRLTGPEIRVRFARSGETIKALDGKSYALSLDNLLIADSSHPVAIAGVMGGEETGTTGQTVNVLLESAYFRPSVVRKSSQKLRLKSDSSYRFERGVDPGAVAEASERAAALIVQLGGPEAKVSAPRVAGAQPAAPKPITVSVSRLNEILGSAFPEADVEGALRAIAQSLQVESTKLHFTPPTHRGDLETVWDLAEETARLLGYDNVPSVAAPISPRPAKLTPYESLAERCRSRLAALGLLEAYNYDFVSEKALKQAGLSPDSCAKLANPLSDDWTYLRPTLLLGLLANAATNLNRGASSVRLFELGTRYKPVKGHVAEKRHAAGLMLGPVSERFWQAARTPDAGFYDAKGLAEDLLSGLPGLAWTPLRQAKTQLEDDVFFHPGASLRVESPKGPLGTVGLLHPTIARAWGLDRQPVALFDFDLERLAKLESPRARFAPYSQFPVSRRDLSLLVDTGKPYAELEAAARQGAGAPLQSVELVDVFTGKGLPAGKHSVTLRLTFGVLDRTLTEPEVLAGVDGALGALKALGAELRG